MRRHNIIIIIFIDGKKTQFMSCKRNNNIHLLSAPQTRRQTPRARLQYNNPPDDFVGRAWSVRDLKYFRTSAADLPRYKQLCPAKNIIFLVGGPVTARRRRRRRPQSTDLGRRRRRCAYLLRYVLLCRLYIIPTIRGTHYSRCVPSTGVCEAIHTAPPPSSY